MILSSSAQRLIVLSSYFRNQEEIVHNQDENVYIQHLSNDSEVTYFFSKYHTEAEKLVYRKLLKRNFISSAARRLILLANHFRANQSAREKNTNSREVNINDTYMYHSVKCSLR